MDTELPHLTPREVALTATRDRAAVITGMRRSGKTWRLYQEMARLRDEGVPARHMLYANLDDSRVEEIIRTGVTPLGFLHGLVETFYRLSPSAPEAGAYLFLDELQEIDGWARFARTLLDSRRAAVYITGSSAKLLSTEIATQFRGRSLVHELLPFSFREYARHHGVDPVPGGSEAHVATLEAMCDRYLVEGGFPGVTGLLPNDRISLLQDYARLVVMRDVLERHGLTNVVGTMEAADSLLAANGTLVSANKVAERVKARGVAITREAVTALMAALEDAFLLFRVPVYTHNLQRARVNPKKLYVIDPGLAFALSGAPTSNHGQRLEGAVYLELRRRFPHLRAQGISYYRTQDGREVDFVAGDPVRGQPLELIQACQTLRPPATREREVKALVSAMSELGLRTGVIVTLYESERITTDAGEITVTPAWKWLTTNPTPAG
jgi:predicted AAA+ superfamily ATPase